jgi:hypothetical protein
MLPSSSPLNEVLLAAGPAPDRAERMMLYGQFIGSWEGTMLYPRPGGPPLETSCEVHFGWVLEGRAVQDVWMAPARGARKEGQPPLMYGTTLRVCDPERDVWQITWNDPVRQVFNTMTGRKVGSDIVQQYRTETGALREWRFTEITGDSFHWIAREAGDDPEQWKVLGEFFLRRRSPVAP